MSKGSLQYTNNENKELNEYASWSPALRELVFNFDEAKHTNLNLGITPRDEPLTLGKWIKGVNELKNDDSNVVSFVDDDVLTGEFDVNFKNVDFGGSDQTSLIKGKVQAKQDEVKNKYAEKFGALTTAGANKTRTHNLKKLLPKIYPNIYPNEESVTSKSEFSPINALDLDVETKLTAASYYNRASQLLTEGVRPPCKATKKTEDKDKLNSYVNKADLNTYLNGVRHPLIPYNQVCLIPIGSTDIHVIVYKKSHSQSRVLDVELDNIPEYTKNTNTETIDLDKLKLNVNENPLFVFAASARYTLPKILFYNYLKNTQDSEALQNFVERFDAAEEILQRYLADGGIYLLSDFDEMLQNIENDLSVDTIEDKLGKQSKKIFEFIRTFRKINFGGLEKINVMLEMKSEKDGVGNIKIDDIIYCLDQTTQKEKSKPTPLHPLLAYRAAAPAPGEDGGVTGGRKRKKTKKNKNKKSKNKNHKKNKKFKKHTNRKKRRTKKNK
jgi:hypothetical protein